MLGNKHDLDLLKKRFTSDFKIPITIFLDQYWDWFLELFEKGYSAKTKWNKLVDLIDSEYLGDPMKFLEDYKNHCETLIQWVRDNKKFNEFNQSKDLQKFGLSEELKGIKKTDIYNEDNIGKHFISIDLKKANFQVISYITGLSNGIYPIKIDKIYLDWIKSIFPNTNQGMIDYLFQSKFTREFIFGNCNPGRQILVERWLVSKAWNRDPGLKVIQLGSDELVLEVLDGQEHNIIIPGDIDARVENFTLEQWTWKTHNDALEKIYRRNTGQPISISQFRGIKKYYMPQIYEDIYGIPRDKEGRDRLFFLEKAADLCQFINPLEKCQIRK